MFHPLRTLMLGLGIFSFVGCSSITFVQYEQAGEHETINRWHHATLNGMVEISSPLDIQDICGKKAWTRITTEFTFNNFLVGFFIPNVGVFSLYTGWTNKVQCYEMPVAEIVTEHTPLLQ